MTGTSEATPLHIDAIDPARIPQRILYTGASMPAIGLGTFGSDHVSHQAVADAVTFASEVGYRHFDCASVYGNEDRIGVALKRLFQTGLRREEAWITFQALERQACGEGCHRILREVPPRPATRVP